MLDGAPKQEYKFYKRMFNVFSGLTCSFLVMSSINQDKHDLFVEEIQKNPEAICRSYYEVQNEKQDINIKFCMHALNNLPDKLPQSELFNIGSLFTAYGAFLAGGLGYIVEKQNPNINNDL